MTDEKFLWNHGEASSALFAFACPSCGTVSHDPMDRRFGYCGTCHDFTGDPTDFIYHVLPGEEPTDEQEAFSERVHDMLVHRLATEEPVRVALSEDDLAALHVANRDALRTEQYLALTIRSIGSYTQFGEFRDRALARSWKVRWAYRYARLRCALARLVHGGL